MFMSVWYQNNHKKHSNLHAQLVKLAKEDPKWVRDLSLNLSRKLRERTKLPDKNPDK